MELHPLKADWSSYSSGKKLALRYTGRDDIRMEAQGGRMGRETVKRIHEATLKDRTIVLGLDL